MTRIVCGVVLVTSLVAAAGCSSSGSSCAVGTETCACTGAGQCDPGLVCTSNRCVKAGGGTGPMTMTPPGSMTPPAMTPPASPMGARAVLELEPFRGAQFSVARPAGWPRQQPSATDPPGAENLLFLAPDAEQTGVGALHVSVATVPWQDVNQSYRVLDEIVMKQNFRVVSADRCCPNVLNLAPWAAAFVETGKTGATRIALIVVTTNRPDGKTTTAVLSINTLFGASVEQLKAVDAQFVLLNVAMSVGPSNALAPAMLHGKWQSASGGGVDWVDSSGNYVAGNVIGDYQQFNFLPEGKYELISGKSASGTGVVNLAVMIWESGSYAFEAGALSLRRGKCLARQYRDGVKSAEDVCWDNMSPLAVRIEPRDAGHLALTGVALNPYDNRQPSHVYPARK